MSKLDGRVAVVTAAGAGIGRASSLAMSRLGARVLVTDIREDAAKAVADEITREGFEAASLRVDVETPADIRTMINYAVQTFGRLDILHNNANLIDSGIYEKDRSLLTLDVESWDRVMAVNLRSVMLACQIAIPAMIQTGGGSIINTASTLGISADIELPAYGTSKAGIIRLSSYVAAEFGKKGIRCNVVAPGLIMAPALAASFPPELINANLDAALTPFLGEPQDVANAVAFLASDDARYITGHVIPVDGGTTAHLPTIQDYRRFYSAN